MTTSNRITEMHLEVQTFGRGKITAKEKAFLETLHTQAQSPSFALTPKQAVWFNAIARKLEATKGKPLFQVIAERHSQRFHRYQESYQIACFGR